MELVVDANIVISALISSSGETRHLLFHEEIHLFAPEYLLKEIGKHKKEILHKSKLTDIDLEKALDLVCLRIEFVPFSKFEKYIPRAKEISPDPDDIEYVALALKLNHPLWSNDKRLKQQKYVKIYSTTELLET